MLENKKRFSRDVNVVFSSSVMEFYHDLLLSRAKQHRNKGLIAILFSASLITKNEELLAGIGALVAVVGFYHLYLYSEYTIRAKEVVISKAQKSDS